MQPECFPHTVARFAARSIEAVERVGKVFEKLGAVGLYAGAYAVEYIRRHTVWIPISLDHNRRYGADQCSLSHAMRPMPPDVTGNFTSARGMADVDSLFKVEELCECREVISVGIHVVTGPRLR